MGEYDAASIVGQMAGLGSDGPKPEPVTPARLIARFCDRAQQNDYEREAGTPSVTSKDGVTTARGFCGYSGGRSDSMLTGFDDGYDFMAFLEERGWRALPAKGDWPYVVYLTYLPRAPYAIAEYCEADLTVWTFETAAQAQAHYRGLRDCP